MGSNPCTDVLTDLEYLEHQNTQLIQQLVVPSP